MVIGCSLCPNCGFRLIPMFYWSETSSEKFDGMWACKMCNHLFPDMKIKLDTEVELDEVEQMRINYLQKKLE